MTGKDVRLETSRQGSEELMKPWLQMAAFDE
jgi:hypothetical protein